MKYAALIAVLLAVATPVQAQDAAPAAAVVLGESGFGGTGCPDGTALVVAGFGKQAAAYMFDAYSVGSNGRAVDRQTCGIAIPVTVPSGTAVAIRNIALRGTATLPADLDATLAVEAFVAGDSGEVSEISFNGPSDTGFLRFVSIADDKLVWSGCGQDTNLRVNTSLRTRGDKEAKLALDAMIVYPLATKAC